MEKKFGLIGRHLSHSFSKDYFEEKFYREGRRDFHYNLYELQNINELDSLLERDTKICGLNVTIPYKEQVIEKLHKIDKKAKIIGAVNVIKIKDGIVTGYNTDSDAFADTLTRWFPNPKGSKAIVLGTGGVSKAVQQTLKELKIKFLLVSRRKEKAHPVYEDLQDKKYFAQHNLIINATPLGMSPHTTQCPPIPYEHITPNHFVYDLIYNPARSLFIQKAEMHGAQTKNGLEMLHIQAEKSWSIWNKTMPS